VRALAGAFAASWLILPGFGLVDLAVTWSSDWPQVLEAGWGLLFTVFVGVPFVVVAARPRSATPGIVELFVAAGALLASTFLADEPRLAWLALAVAVEAAIVSRVPGREPLALRGRPAHVSRPLASLAALGLVPWLAYALDMYALNRAERFDRDITIGIDHYAVQGAAALAVVVLAVLAAMWPQGRRFVGCSVGVVAGYLGLVSLSWQDAAGGFSRGWSVAALTWGLAFLAVSLVPAGVRGTSGRRPIL